jgi:hypothetical protein
LEKKETGKKKRQISNFNIEKAAAGNYQECGGEKTFCYPIIIFLQSSFFVQNSIELLKGDFFLG